MSVSRPHPCRSAGRRHDAGRMRSSGLRAGRRSRRRAGAPAGPSWVPERPAGLAMDHRNRAAPVALAGNAPVAQPEVHLALALRPVARRRDDSVSATTSKAAVGAQASRWRELTIKPVIDIGDIGDGKLSSCVFRADDGDEGKLVFVGEIKGRAGSPDGQRKWRPCRNPSARNWRSKPEPSRTDRADGRRAGQCRGPSSRPFRARQPRFPCRRHSSQKAAIVGIAGRQFPATGWSAEIARKEAPNKCPGGRCRQ